MNKKNVSLQAVSNKLRVTTRHEAVKNTSFYPRLLRSAPNDAKLQQTTDNYQLTTE